MTLEEEWQRWRECYDTTHNGVLRLFHDRAIWRTILAMLEANPAVARGGFGEYWLGSCYTTSQLIGIRRETGTDNKSVGMLRSLNSLASTPGWQPALGTDSRLPSTVTPKRTLNACSIGSPDPLSCLSTQGLSRRTLPFSKLSSTA